MSTQSQVIMVPASQTDPISAAILVNLGEEVPTGFASFERVIEVVSTEASDRDHARRRWKHYTAQGYAIDRHDLALKS
jgi:DNA polymerase-3 subunit chi